MTKSDIKQSSNKKSHRGDESDSDDSSVDSKGNIKDLIDYDYTSESESVHFQRPKRKAAIIARKKIKQIVSNENSDSKNTLKQPINNTPHPITKKAETVSKRKYPFNKIIKQVSSKISPTSKSSSETSTFKHFKKAYEKEYENEDDDDEEESNSDNESDKDVSSNSDESDTDSETLSDTSSISTENEPQIKPIPHRKSASRPDKEFSGIVLSLSSASSGNPMIPRKYNMKKETKNVQQFVKLLTLPSEDNTIDTQITQFKALDETKQKELITALENRPTANDTGIGLMLKILTLKLPQQIQGMILSKYNNLQSLDTSSNEYFKLRSWLDKVVSIPFGIYKDIPVRLEDGNEKCGEFMRTAKKHLDSAVYGQDESKLQIMQFISTKIANPEHRGLSLLLVGPPGIGKTTIIKNGIAKALGWPFQFISLGGDSDASTYTGHQLVYESSHCGKIVNSLISSKSMSTVIMFDEIDKISQTPKGEEIMNLLIHLTDPVQNGEFEDKYLSGIPIDLSKVMFVFSANDINKIDKVLLDRMMVINLKGYDVKQKTVIAQQHLLPSAMQEVNLTERIAVSKDILTYIIEEYANEEKGVRELKRCIEQVTQKINMLRMFNSPELPFYIKDFSLPFIVKQEHVRLFIKKKETDNSPPIGMYI